MRTDRALPVSLSLGACLFLALGLLALGCGPDSDPSETDAAGVDSGGQGGPGARRGGQDAGHGGRGGGRPGGRGAFAMNGPMSGGRGDASNAIPVEVIPVERRSIAQYLETNGTLEAENEVDVVARTSGPIVELLVEEGMAVEAGELLARLDDREIRALLELATVSLRETRLALDRATAQFENEIISQETYDQARSRFETAEAQIKSQEIQLSYTEIRAPFDGLIIERAVKFAEHIGQNAKLFRLSDFDPLLCPIQVPEKDLPRLALGQTSYLTVEAFDDLRFAARVLRISPVVDAATGTVKVTLEVQGRKRLRPGMFASVFLETDRRQGSMVIPKSALVLESLGDTVYVMTDGVAVRRDVRLGYDEAESVEVIDGLAEGEVVIVVGQDSISDGTPVYTLAKGSTRAEGATVGEPPTLPPAGGERPVPPPGRSQPEARGAASPRQPPPFPGPLGGRRGPPDPSNLSPEQLELVKERMRGRGLSDEQIEERLKRMREGRADRPPPERRR